VRSAAIIIGAGLAIIAVTQLSAVDLWLSDRAYDFDLGIWAIDHSSSVWRPVFYDGPKALIILFGLVLLAAIIRPAWLTSLRISRREAVFLFVSLATVPAVVGLVREYSSVSCPRALQHYGGQVDDSFGHVDVTQFFQKARPGGCWPSAHASGGFALLSLAFLGRTWRTRLQFAVFSLGVGSAMGTYQVLRGAHFASHVVVTSLIALALIQILASLEQRIRP
jgi:membrane-associated PAP2 superfamily phosphatase